MCRPYRAYGLFAGVTQGAAQPSPATGYGGQALGWYNAAPLGLRTAPLALRT